MNERNDLQVVREKLEVDLNFSSSHTNETEWIEALISRIDELILHDFERLVRILYRLDINELKIKQLLKHSPDKDAGAIIANLMIDREWQKIKSRQQFNDKDDAIDETEKW